MLEVLERLSAVNGQLTSTTVLRAGAGLSRHIEIGP